MVNWRKKMNEFVNTVNKKIAETTKKTGNQIVFVDYKLDICTSSGQFCKKGIDKPNPDR